MAGLDTLDHEPVQKDHPMLSWPEKTLAKLLFSPHIGGITGSSFHRGYAMIWEDIEKLSSLNLLCDLVQQALRIFPAKAWVGNGLTVAVLTNFLVARLDIALDHYALDQPV